MMALVWVVAVWLMVMITIKVLRKPRKGDDK